MKNVLALITLCFVAFGNTQEKVIDIDYTVQYLIPKKRSTEVDTVSVGFNKEGKYLWTDSKFLAKDLAKSFFKNKEDLLNNAELNIVLDTENLTLMLFFNSGDNVMFMNLELSNLVPLPPPSKNNKDIELIAEPTGDVIKILDKKAEVYDVYPSNDPNDSVYFAFDTSIEVKNNRLFEKFFSLFFAAEDNSKMKSLNFPNGLLLSISDEDETIITANAIDTTTKTITLNYSFKISE